MEGQHVDELGSVVSSTFEDNSTTQHETINKINSQNNNNLINQISIKNSDVQNNKQIISSHPDNKTFHTNSQQNDNLTHQQLHQRHQHQLKVEWSPRSRRTSSRKARRDDRRWFTTTK